MTTASSQQADKVVIELNPREQRLYDRMRAHLADPTVRGSGLLDLLLLLPDMTVLLMRLVRDERVPLGAKGLALLGVGYVISPLDLLPEMLLGPIAWIDDLLIVGAALSRILNVVHPDIVRSHWPGKQDALEAIHRVTSWAEDQIGGTVRSLFRRVFQS